MSDSPFHLRGKKILVTGASGGIGAQTAISISEMGGMVVATGRKEKQLSETYAQLKGDGHQQFTCDLGNEKAIKDLTSIITGLDGVVHCAGIAELVPVKYITRQKIDESFNINYTANVLLMSLLLRARKINPGASIVFISSFSGTYPFRGGALYTGTKAALENYSQVLATEHAASGIRSNCISPGLVQTPMISEILSEEQSDYMDVVKDKYLLGICNPLDVAHLVVFLLADASKRLTGQNIILDGGFLLGSVSKGTNIFK